MLCVASPLGFLLILSHPLPLQGLGARIVQVEPTLQALHRQPLLLEDGIDQGICLEA